MTSWYDAREEYFRKWGKYPDESRVHPDQIAYWGKTASGKSYPVSIGQAASTRVPYEPPPPNWDVPMSRPPITEYDYSLAEYNRGSAAFESRFNMPARPMPDRSIYDDIQDWRRGEYVESPRPPVKRWLNNWYGRNLSQYKVGPEPVAQGVPMYELEQHSYTPKAMADEFGDAFRWHRGVADRILADVKSGKYESINAAKASPEYAPLLRSATKSGLRTAGRVLGAGLTILGAAVLLPDIASAMAPISSGEAKAARFSHERTESYWNIAQYGPSAALGVATLGLLAAAPFTGGATLPFAAQTATAGMGYMVAAGVARTALAEDKMSTGLQHVVIPAATAGILHGVNRYFSSRAVGQAAASSAGYMPRSSYAGPAFLPSAAREPGAFNPVSYAYREQYALARMWEDVVIPDSTKKSIFQTMVEASSPDIQGLKMFQAAEFSGLDSTAKAGQTSIANFGKNYLTGWDLWKSQKLIGNVTGGKAFNYLKLASKIALSPWLDIRKEKQTWDVWTKSSTELQAQGINPVNAAVMRSQSHRWFIQDAITGFADVSQRGNWGDLKYTQADIGEVLKDPISGFVINAEMLFAFYGKRISQREQKAYARQMIDEAYNWKGGTEQLGNAAYGMARPGIEYSATLGAIGGVTAGIGGAFRSWTGTAGVGRMAQASQAFDYGLSNKGPLAEALFGWRFDTRAKGPWALFRGMNMAAATMLTGNKESGIAMGDTLFASWLGLGTLMGILKNKDVDPRYAPAASANIEQSRSAAIISDFARSKVGALGSYRNYSMQQTAANSLGFANNFNILASINNSAGQLATGKTWMSPFLAGREVRDVYTPTEMISNLLTYFPNQYYNDVANRYTERVYDQSDYLTRLSAQRQVMSVRGALPFRMTPAVADMLGTATTKYSSITRAGTQYFYRKEGNIYNAFASDTGMDQPDTLLGTRAKGTKEIIKATLASPADFALFMQRFNDPSNKIVASNPLSNMIYGQDVVPAGNVRIQKLIGLITGTAMQEASSVLEAKIKDTKSDYTFLMNKIEEGGGGFGNLKFIPPDPIYVDALTTGGDSPYSDAMITAVITDSIQEWNWRSPRRGGAPFEGRY